MIVGQGLQGGYEHVLPAPDCQPGRRGHRGDQERPGAADHPRLLHGEHHEQRGQREFQALYIRRQAAA
ncbi:MAG: hypothetical protein U5L11_02700 [Arhodomonas sp.]|nr:hypothetical protein [Arhodomonas sp.]